MSRIVSKYIEKSTIDFRRDTAALSLNYDEIIKVLAADDQFKKVVRKIVAEENILNSLRVKTDDFELEQK